MTKPSKRKPKPMYPSDPTEAPFSAFLVRLGYVPEDMKWPYDLRVAFLAGWDARGAVRS